jgi:hypothetical protein
MGFDLWCNFSEKDYALVLFLEKISSKQINCAYIIISISCTLGTEELPFLKLRFDF